MAIALLLDRRVKEGYTASMSIVYILTMAPSPTGFCNSVIFHHTSTQGHGDVSVGKCERDVRVNRRLQKPNDAKKRGLSLLKPDVGGSTDTMDAGMKYLPQYIPGFSAWWLGRLSRLSDIGG